MIKTMKNRMFSIIAFIIALVFWFSDSLIHYFLYSESTFEMIPDDFNELWMRTVIILLILLFGVFTDNYSRKMVIVQKQLEANRIYKSMTHATHHILNNLLNQMQIVKLEALKCDDFDKNIINMYDSAINEASNLISSLSQVKNISEESIWASIDPNNIKNAPNNDLNQQPK